MTCDLTVIGGGAAGCRAAEMAAGEGMSVVLCEKARVGGGAFHKGFLPMRILMDMVALSDHVQSAPLAPSIGFPPLGHKLSVSQVDAIVQKTAAQMRERLQSRGVTLVEGNAMLTGREQSLFKIQAGEERILSKRVLAATGSVPVIPRAFKHKRTGRLLSFSDILHSAAPPHTLVVWGAGLRSLQMAAYLSHIGAQVTVVEEREHASQLLDRLAYDCLLTYLQERGVRFLFRHTIASMEQDRVLCAGSHDSVTVEAEGILVGDRRRPALRGLGLRSLVPEGVPLEELCGAEAVPDVPGLYMAGEIDASCQTMYASVRQAEACIDAMMGRRHPVRYEAIPGSTPIAGELAWVGLPSHMLSGETVTQVYLPMQLAQGKPGGWCRLYADRRTEQLVGAHMRGENVSSLAYELAATMRDSRTLAATRRMLSPCTPSAEVLCDALAQLQTAVRQDSGANIAI